MDGAVVLGHNSCMDKKRQIFGWAMYDWANSAYVTTVVVAVLPAYFAAAVVPKGGYDLLGTTLPATSLWGYAVGFASLLVFIIGPLLGAMADYSGSRLRALMAFCAMGSLAAMGLFFTGPGLVLTTLALFIVAQVGFVGGNVFYDAFLPHLASEAEQDRVSGKGFSFGYLGGGLQFAMSMGIIAGHEQLGISQDLAARLAILFAGVWWAGFSLVTFTRLREPAPPRPLPPEYAGGSRLKGYAAVGFGRVRSTWRTLLLNKPLRLFLLAFFFYNDGIQTVITMATIYGKEELGFSTTDLMVTLLVIQFVAVAGAKLFTWISSKTGARRALMIALVVWSGIAVYAWFLTTTTEYFIMGALVGCVLGGSQALSRSFYASMIPQENSAEYFGYFSVIHRFSSIIGPTLFAVVAQFTGGARPAMLGLVVFFVVGLVLLHRLGKTEGAPGSAQQQ